MNVEADALSLEGVDQLRCQTRQVNSQTLHSIIEIRINRLNHRITTTVIDVDGCDAPGFHVIEEAAIAHPGNCGVAWSLSWATWLQVAQRSAAEELQCQQQSNSDGKSPEKDLPPALIHGIDEDPTIVRASGYKLCSCST